MSTAAATGGEVARDPAPSPARGVRVDVPQTENEQRRCTEFLCPQHGEANWLAALAAAVETDPRAIAMFKRMFPSAETFEFPSAPSVQTGETTMNAYPIEVLGEDDDNGTMPANVETLAEAVVGHRIVSCERSEHSHPQGVYGGNEADAIITLDNGKQVILAGSDDCCAFTSLNAFLLHPERVDHIITGVGTTDGYQKWHIFADLGDVLELEVDWSPGNPFYYGYGFEITVTDVPPAAGVSG